MTGSLLQIIRPILPATTDELWLDVGLIGSYAPEGLPQTREEFERELQQLQAAGQIGESDGAWWTVRKQKPEQKGLFV